MGASVHTVCPYFTMFPIEFPVRVLRRAQSGDSVLDPFCGRGTTNYAARTLGLASVGIDSSPVAAAIAEAKLPRVQPEAVIRCGHAILAASRERPDLPRGAFWQWAFHEETLLDLCTLRGSLLRRCSSDTRIVLRAIILGALHGPRNRGLPSYLSNQAPRTYAPKPGYALRFWRSRGLRPPRVDVLDLIRRRAAHYLSEQPAAGRGAIIRGDSRDRRSFPSRRRYHWVITSPPYYGMRTYLPDQWLRYWFLGGPDHVDYSHPSDAVVHAGPETFADDLRQVWLNAAAVSKPGAHLVVRFGAIHDRLQPPLDLLRSSLRETGWRVTTIHDAGDAHAGRRQADQFKGASARALREHDVYARLEI